jgi:hypothetical protein
MGEERPFDIAKPRTPKGEARVRERVTMDAMGILMAIQEEEKFKEALYRFYRIMPGEPRYEEALAVWRQGQISK